MTATTLVASLGATAGFGLTGLASSVSRRSTAGARLAATDPPSPARSMRVVRRYGPTLAVGAVLGVATGWPVAVVIGAAGALALTRTLIRRKQVEPTRRIEAIATWTELLRDTLLASSGLSQAIVESTRVAPPDLRPEVGRLADRIASGVGMSEALHAFADEVDDPSADLVVCALVLATEAQAPRLTDLLSALAAATREEVSMRLRVEAGRASARGSVRTIVVFSIGFAALMATVARGYLAPFDDTTGQLVLLAVGGLYGSGIWLMARLVRYRPAARLLAGASD